MSTDPESHVVLDGGQLRCLHCGQSWRLRKPNSATTVARASKAFEHLHLNCTPKEVQK